MDEREMAARRAPSLARRAMGGVRHCGGWGSRTTTMWTMRSAKSWTMAMDSHGRRSDPRLSAFFTFENPRWHTRTAMRNVLVKLPLAMEPSSTSARASSSPPSPRPREWRRIRGQAPPTSRSSRPRPRQQQRRR
ncbi:hypothetical protein DAI22_02g306000 [Oryza sativa Japonica Group]|nr:hypothetical protein DAI22_02g306000 [Oryza sativa Japonica Group]